MRLCDGCHLVVSVLWVGGGGVSLFPGPAGEGGDEEKEEATQQHTAPTEVESQVIGLHPVGEPACQEKQKISVNLVARLLIDSVHLNKYYGKMAAVLTYNWRSQHDPETAKEHEDAVGLCEPLDAHHLGGGVWRDGPVP